MNIEGLVLPRIPFSGKYRWTIIKDKEHKPILNLQKKIGPIWITRQFIGPIYMGNIWTSALALIRAEDAALFVRNNR